MALDVDKEVAQMRCMSVRQLQAKFAEVCREQPRSHNRQWMIKRLAWKLQAREYGGLSELALRRASDIANTCDLSDLRLTAPRELANAAVATSATPLPTSLDRRLPAVGTVITRKYKGRTLCVQVLGTGFLYEGERFKSLSAVARRITGSAWNGFLFFGLTKRGADA